MTELIDGLYYEGEKIADTKAPHSVPIDRRWEQRKFEAKLVNPANRRKLDIIVVGSGLAGGAAAASLGEQGYNVKVFFYQDSARRAHSIAAQGGINAAKNYRNDGDSVYRLFYDTVKGGDYRAREDNVYRLAEVSANIIDQCVAQGVPFAREYGGLLDNRSFGGVQVSRTFYARGQTGQQLLIGAYQALERQVHAGTVKEFRRHEMVELIIVDGRARGIVTRDMVSGKIETHLADAVVLASGGYGNVFFLSTNAMGCNATAVWRAHRKGAYFANPCYTQIHPTCIPQSGDFQSKLTLMSESLRNDGRIWVPVRPGDERPPNEIPEDERDYYLERKYPAFGNLTPRDVASRNAREQIESGRGVGPLRNSVYLDFRDALERLGKETIASRYGNLFEMYLDATGEDPYEVPMRIAPGAHFTMGGLWVDFDQMSTIPGLFVGGEASNNYHGANRLGANSLLSASVDGWFVLPLAVPNYLAGLVGSRPLSPDAPEALQAVADTRARIEALMAVGGTHRPVWFHRRLGEILYAGCGVSRSEAGLLRALEEVRALREEFWADVTVVGGQARLNQELEKALRVADFLELAEVMVLDALDRRESAGAHFREEYATQGGEARRNDETWCSVSAWQTGDDGGHTRRTEPLSFSLVPMQVRDYR